MLNPQTGEELSGNDIEGVLAFKRPWPSLTRTIYGDHKRYLDVYLRPYQASFVVHGAVSLLFSCCFVLDFPLTFRAQRYRRGRFDVDGFVDPRT